ncbi:DYRK4 isoform 2 [Pongo abelii]|uniref:DYRK4 isoform 2 n=1 Tax=Pongo abelii TaxID=9601 RepID=A0A2J8TAU7_PONAB|nr:DYRK4 isoform 2 [Pongo abelii]
MQLLPQPIRTGTKTQMDAKKPRKCDLTPFLVLRAIKKQKFTSAKGPTLSEFYMEEARRSQLRK